MSTKKIYLPSCQDCKGLLNFKIQPLNFSIDYECDNNKTHNKSDIYFKVFEKFYLKEREVLKCCSCKLNLENAEYFNCDICKNIYCCKCYIEDIQINGHKNIINNIKNYNNKCINHYNEFIGYCLNCKTNICILCIKEDTHKDHNTNNYIDIMPSTENIEHLVNKIKAKSVYTKKLIEKIDNWKKIINKKVENLKQNLRDEICLFEKIIVNFNNNFRNYTYFNNFNYINKNIKNTTNNKYLEEFNNTENFERQTEIIMEIFKYMGRRIKKNDGVLKSQGNLNILKNLNYQLAERIEKDYMIFFDYNKIIYLAYLDEPKNTISLYSNISINDYIYSISVSTIENKVFICLLYDKKIKIIDYNLEQLTLNLNRREIIYNSITNINHFYKCIQLTTKLIATSDDNYIIIWTENEINYIQKMKIMLNANIYDLLLIDKDNFISSQTDKKTLSIYNISDLKEVNKIKNIDCINSSNSLFKINNNYIIINCYNGIGLVYIQTKELVQYFQKYQNMNSNRYIHSKKITCDNEGNIHILIIEEYKNTSNSLFNNNQLSSYNNHGCKIKFVVAKIIEDSITLIKEYEKFDLNENKLNISCFDSKNLILLGRNGYIFTGTD